MATRFVGEVITDHFRIVDGMGDGIPGVASTLEANLYTRAPDDSSFAVVITDTGDGYYKVTFTPTLPGDWFWATSYDSPYQDVSASYDVDPNPSATSGGTITVAGGDTTTLRDLRQRLGTILGDMMLLEATSNGTTVQFYDVNALTDPRGEYRGRTIHFYAGTLGNIGQRRKVSDSDFATGRLAWGVGLPSATAQGDRAELWNRRGEGWEPVEINGFLTEAHREAQSTFPLAAIYTPNDPFAASVGAISLPDSFRAVTGVEWQDDTGVWRALDRAARPGAPGYWTEKALREVRIEGRPRWNLDARLLRVRGLTEESPLAGDGDVTRSNAEWILARAGELACSALLLRTSDVPLIRDKLAIFRQDAAVKRTMVGQRRPANVDWLG